MLTPHFFADPEFLGLLRFWETSRGTRPVPEWLGNVAALPQDILPNLAIVDFRGDPTYRYFGSELARRWGGDPSGRSVFGRVLRGEQSRYLKSVTDDVFARRAPIFSAAVYESSTAGVVMTGRLIAPFTYEGSAEPCFLLAVQLFRGSDEEMRAVDVVHELRRDLITDAGAVWARLDEAGRHYQIARHTRGRALAHEVEAIARELTGRAVMSLPCLEDPEPGTSA